MSVETALAHLASFNACDRVKNFDSSTATVDLAAESLGVEPGMIAKTLAIRVKSSGDIIVVVAMGRARLDNTKFKNTFGGKPQFISADECLDVTGHPPGGVSPFGLKEGVAIYLDESLRKYDVVYPAAGSPNNCVRTAIPELEQWTGGRWTDVCSWS